MVASSVAQAYDVTDSLSIGGVVAATGQCQSLSDDAGEDDDCKGAMAIQPEISLRPGGNDEFFMKLGYGVGNGLNNSSPFAFSTFAADLEDDVKDINGRDRDYLLTAWYKHTLTFDDGSLGLTFGIVDSADYLDQSTYANDEFTQFLNQAFVNSRSNEFPAYDAGAALQWERGNWSVNVVGMSVGKNEDDNEFLYAGTQIGYRTNSSWGEGTIRLTIAGTNDRFGNPNGTDDDERRLEAVITLDQAFGDYWGAFARVGIQSDDPAIVYESIITAGLAAQGGLWGRPSDNVGIALGYLDGGNQQVDRTRVFETYYRLAINDRLALTGDIQWLRDDSAISSAEDAAGWVFGLRLAAGF
jgi:porin